MRPKTLAMLLLGFSSGLPFLLVGNTFGYWLRDAGVSLTAIGFISWVGIAYSLKFLLGSVDGPPGPAGVFAARTSARVDAVRTDCRRLGADRNGRRRYGWRTRPAWRVRPGSRVRLVDTGYRD